MAAPDVVCLSHVPWAFGLERPHQVMRRFARERQVFFVEEPCTTDGELRTVMRTVEPNVHVVSVNAPRDMSERDVELAHRRCIGSLTNETSRPLLWVYAPRSARAASPLEPSLLVYDCVANHGNDERELALLAAADLVITAGSSLFEAKRGLNVSTFPLPSSVDATHFAARAVPQRPRSAKTRVGFLGPIDERVDLALIDTLADARPGLEIVLAGGLASGMTTWQLPDRPNVRWLGAIDYSALPAQVASWDVAIIPFRTDAAARRTEPSGLLACIAAGKAIVSTPLDEVTAYAELGLVKIARPKKFASAVDGALREARTPRSAARAKRQLARDGVLARTSWDRTFSAMARLVGEAEMTRKLAIEASHPQATCRLESSMTARLRPSP